MPQTIAAIIHPADTEPDEGAAAVKRVLRVVHVETRMEKQVMGEQHMCHTGWNDINWLILFRWSDRFSKLRLTKLQTVNS